MSNRRRTATLHPAWRRILAGMIVCTFSFFIGCHHDMYQQPKYKPYTVNPFFPDSLASRPLVAGTVVHSDEPQDELLTAGTVDGKIKDEFPFPVTKDVLVRGQERFNIFCSPCHGRFADGQGMIVQRGFPAPPSFHSDTMRARPAGSYFDVITHGFGRMYSYAQRIHPKDRWAIIAYIRALQLSQHTNVTSLDDADRRKIAGGTKGGAR